jgi:Uma2 family endonuclease
MVVSSSQQILTDTWVKATWDEFVSVAYDDPAYTEGRAYFDAGYMRIEMASSGVAHGRQNGVVWDVITLFVLAKKLNIAKYANGSICKSGERGFQPDAAFYIGDTAKYLPPQNNSPLNIDLFGSPTLIVEVGASSLIFSKGQVP